MKQYKIQHELAQAILNYLGTKPFSEVYQMVSELQRLEELTVVSDKVEAKEEKK